ncbi:SH3 domain-containing protein [Peribacillus frigoritolerans]|nr:SH3 domain-containing protein [Peribacillus frigoritolerans]
MERQTGSDTNQVKKESGQGTISGSSVRVRTGPGTTFQTVGSLSKGTFVDIIEKNENWIKVKTADIEGWVSADYITLPSASEKAAKKDSTKGKRNESIRKNRSNFGGPAQCPFGTVDKQCRSRKAEYKYVSDRLQG